MSSQLALLSILGTLAIGAMSPGPSFVVVVRAPNLVNLGIRLCRGARNPLPTMADDGRPATGGWRRSFVVGFATQISNPKTAIWYARIVALLFSASGPRAVYLRGKHWIDRVAGGVVTALGGRLIIEALRAAPVAAVR
jgi:threonine/homoserine/homoserine lactone efflux protein